MSSITGVTVITTNAREDSPALTAIWNARFGAYDSPLGELDMDAAAGTKGSGITVWVSGLNYVSPTDLLDWFANIPLGPWGEVVMVLRHERDEAPTVATRCGVNADSARYVPLPSTPKADT